MSQVGFRAFKAELSRYLREVRSGRSVFVTDRGAGGHDQARRWIDAFLASCDASCDARVREDAVALGFDVVAA